MKKEMCNRFKEEEKVLHFEDEIVEKNLHVEKRATDFAYLSL